MISLEDLMGFCDLTPDEVDAIAEHEHIAAPLAAAFATSLIQSENGLKQIRDMLMDGMRMAVRRHDVAHARHLVSTLRTFLHKHPTSKDGASESGGAGN